MPYHSNSPNKSPMKKKKNSPKKDNKKKKDKMPVPMGKPKKSLSVLQNRLMKEHKKHHTKEHLKMMRELMLKGYCFQQSHSITMKKIGK